MRSKSALARDVQKARIVLLSAGVFRGRRQGLTATGQTVRDASAPQHLHGFSDLRSPRAVQPFHAVLTHADPDSRARYADRRAPDGPLGGEHSVRASDKKLALDSLRGALTRENFYFVMTDRFANGDRFNDEGRLAGTG